MLEDGRFTLVKPASILNESRVNEFPQTPDVPTQPTEGAEQGISAATNLQTLSG
jgi:hypothetical protein